jgi:ribosomal protein L11 methyltransferase
VPEDPPDRSVHRFELPTRPDQVELVAASLWANGAVGVWEQPDRLVAWFPTTDVTVPDGGSWSLEPDRDWQAEWKATIQPVRAGRIVVVPSWLADDHPTVAGDVTLVLDPGRAFGSGHHATTTLCLELLDELDLDGRTVADIGCGTGILGIAAARRGAEVVAVDLDPEAVTVTRENAARNGVELTVTTGSVDSLAGPVEVVVANLVTDVVVALAEPLVAATTDRLIVSGVAADRQDRAIRALEAAGAVIEELRQRDGWVAIRARPVPVGS